MKIPFWKMHGAGNDFILADDRAGQFPTADKNWLVRISDRRRGIGSEGIILIQPSSKATFRMRFFNPDGGEVDMCGNGARCVARLAHEIGAAPVRMSIETEAGILRAEVIGDQVRLFMTDPKDWRLDKALQLDGQSIRYSFVNSGVPHVVVEVPDVSKVDVQHMGSAIRYHSAFAPGGTNANFITVTGPDTLQIRTYERGVEGETLACGTGIVASGLIAGISGRVKPPVRITTAGGDILEVSYSMLAGAPHEVTLLGPAAHVFQGTLEYT